MYEGSHVPLEQMSDFYGKVRGTRLSALFKPIHVGGSKSLDLGPHCSRGPWGCCCSRSEHVSPLWLDGGSHVPLAQPLLGARTWVG